MIASWHDDDTGKTQTVTAGAGNPTFRIRHVHASRQRARQAAQAKLNACKRGTARLSLSLPGNPMIAAETQIRLRGIRPGVDGPWSATTVTHTLDNAGLTTQIKAEPPID